MGISAAADDDDDHDSDSFGSMSDPQVMNLPKIF